jgi:three-Cys-motif partner protein
MAPVSKAKQAAKGFIRMSPTSDTIWEMDAHTLGKHLVLREYLNAWIPVLGRWNGRILFVDGFSGPGQYSTGEDGSPIIAINAFTEHSHAARFSGEIHFMFIEIDEKRADHLEKLVPKKFPTLPRQCSYQVFNASFDETLRAVLDKMEEDKTRLAPSFFMIDPFGIKNNPMEVIKGIFNHPKCEVFITFMYEFINRFISRPEFEKNLDELYGCPDWRKALSIPDSEKRKHFLYDLYKMQLKANGAKYVVKFELHKGGRHVYTIFFGTQHPKGIEIMKRSIWKIVPGGNYVFRGTEDPQLELTVDTPDYSKLLSQLHKRFGKEKPTAIEEIESFLNSDETEFHSGQLKKALLDPLERSGNLTVVRSPRKKTFTFPPGTVLKFH